MAVVVRAGAAPLWWTGVCAAGIGVVPPGVTGRRIGVMAGAVCFIVAAAVVAYARRGRYAELSRSAARAAKQDVLQDRAVSVRNWRRCHRWWLLLGFLAALGSAFAVPAAGGLLLAGTGVGLWLKAAWLGRRERDGEALLWVRVDWLGKRAGAPAGRAVKSFRSTGAPVHRLRRCRREARGAFPRRCRRRTCSL
ncbi:hypothetical protein, partial [Streptomyces sp. NPDC005568]|uniref:hypothetical protein n=1 Tax=Streptomyces sp. NPDC005568 TaxID=3156887 RepID=UPI0033B2FD11